MPVLDVAGVLEGRGQAGSGRVRQGQAGSGRGQYLWTMMGKLRAINEGAVVRGRQETFQNCIQFPVNNSRSATAISLGVRQVRMCPS